MVASLDWVQEATDILIEEIGDLDKVETIVVRLSRIPIYAGPILAQTLDRLRDEIKQRKP